jgi:ribosomal protein S18 acetylase RimI-like enzyme
MTSGRAPGVTLRRAAVGDASGIAEAHVAAWRAAYEGMIPAAYLEGLSVELAELRWRDQLADEGHAIFVAVDDAKVAGFTNSGPAEDGPDGAGELYTIYLLPDYWDRGIGRRLLELSEDALRRAGFGDAVLWVLEDNARARAFYERNGWRPDGARRTSERGGEATVEVRYAKAL